MHRFSLYFHLPYCRAKCPYCDFNSYALAQWPEAEYTAALIAELEHYAAHPEWQGAVHTIFFGGGTPSLFAPESIAQVLAAVSRLWPANTESKVQSPRPALSLVEGSKVVDPNPAVDCQLSTVDFREVTLEANPGTVTLDTLRGFRAAGINRLSFGVQSFNPRHLERLGRIHDREEAITAIDLARAAGCDNVSLDLIFAVPGQTLNEWESDVRTAIALAPDHLSAYNLTFEEGTVFAAMRRQGQLKPAPEEIEVAMFTRTQELLADAGYTHYEISNYARPGRECRHNLHYWRGGEYLGAGAGAHSFARTPAPGRRWSNEKLPAVYMQRVRDHGHARGFAETLSDSQARGEFVFLGLRCRDGFDATTFVDRFDVDFLSAFPHAASLQRDGFLVRDGSRWQLSGRGLLLADSVFATFV